MELSVFTYIAKDVENDEPLYFKEIIFVKCGKKVYIEITCGVDMEDVADGLDMGIMDIVMPFEMLVFHKHLKAYYDLSLRAKKVGSDTDTIYIIEDALTNAKEAREAKIGKCSHLFNLKKMKEIKVALEPNIAKFLTNYDAKYGCIETDFEDRIAGYTALVDNMF
jgi:response regulator of citrate/malate metabolism